MSAREHDSGTNVLRLRRFGIDTYQTGLIYMSNTLAHAGGGTTALSLCPLKSFTPRGS